MNRFLELTDRYGDPCLILREAITVVTTDVIMQGDGEKTLRLGGACVHCGPDQIFVTQTVEEIRDMLANWE